MVVMAVTFAGAGIARGVGDLQIDLRVDVEQGLNQTGFARTGWRADDE
jgi:hypothetical protein